MCVKCYLEQIKEQSVLIRPQGRDCDLQQVKEQSVLIRPQGRDCDLKTNKGTIGPD
jgi:hypothetical protein